MNSQQVSLRGLCLNKCIFLFFLRTIFNPVWVLITAQTSFCSNTETLVCFQSERTFNIPPYHTKYALNIFKSNIFNICGNILLQFLKQFKMFKLKNHRFQNKPKKKKTLLRFVKSYSGLQNVLWNSRLLEIFFALTW